MDERYDPKIIEPAWQAEWERTDLYLTREDPGRPKFYILEMLPYPSGAGLSVGHLHNYVPCDVVGPTSGWRDSTCCIQWAGMCSDCWLRTRLSLKRIASDRNRPALRRQLQASADDLRMRRRLDARDKFVVARVLPMDSVVLPAAPQARPRLSRERRAMVVRQVPDHPRQRAGHQRMLLAAYRQPRHQKRSSSSGTSRSPSTRIALLEDLRPAFIGAS